MKTIDTITYDASCALELRAKAEQALSNATDYVIDSDIMFQMVSDDLKRIKAIQKEVEEKRISITGPLNQAVKATNDLFRAPKEYLDRAEATLKKSMVAYTTEKQRIVEEERAKVEAERRRLAEEERMALEAAIVAEQEAYAAEMAGDQELAEKSMNEARNALSQADRVAMSANMMAVSSAEPELKVSGISSRLTYRAEVTDMMALVTAVAQGTAPIECLQVDTKFLGQMARAFKKSGQIYPGVQSIEERSISARSF